MDERSARAWLDERGWWESPAGERLRAYVDLLLDEADRQNLISATSREKLWARHIVDSAQLLAIAPEMGEQDLWVDLGSGAGLPGLVVACLRPAPLMMIEMRPLRVAFLKRCIECLGLTHATVTGSKVERAKIAEPAAVISARAYAPLGRLLPSAAHLANSSTTWLLPKGQNGQNELAIARTDWQAVFHVKQSVTDPTSEILMLTDVRRRVLPKKTASPNENRPKRRIGKRS